MPRPRPDLPASATADGGREQAIVDWGYNAWGGKYPPFDLDDVVPTRIGAELGLPVFHPGIVMEGGSIDVNGARHAAHHRGVPAQSRTAIPQLDRAADRAATCATTSASPRSSGWATASWATTPTATSTISPASSTRATVVTVVEDDPADENYEPLQDNLERLRGMTDQDGRPLRVVTLPMPRPL